MATKAAPKKRAKTQTKFPPSLKAPGYMSTATELRWVARKIQERDYQIGMMRNSWVQQAFRTSGGSNEWAELWCLLETYPHRANDPKVLTLQVLCLTLAAELFEDEGQYHLESRYAK